MSACAVAPPSMQPAVCCNPTGIPSELREYPRWVVWKLVPNGNAKAKKPLYDCHTHRAASATDPSTWHSFAKAVHAYRSGGYAGIGFVFHKNDPFVGGDIDNCRDPETGEISEEARAYLTLADTYTEVSQSGTGVKFIARGKKPGKACKRNGCEMYEEGHFFALTGCPVPGTPHTIEERPEEMAGIYRAWFPEVEAERPHSVPRPRPVSPTSLADSELLEKARQARNGAQFARLWDGDISAYGDDDSRADIALCGRLAFWTGGDADRMDSLFRQSGLFRPKWDEMHGDRPYGEQTVEKAIKNCRSSYDPSAKNEAEKRPFYYSEILPRGKICDPEKPSDPTPPLPEKMDLKEWVRAGKSLRQKRDRDELSNRFRIGDWMNATVPGLEFGDRMKWCARIFGKLAPEVRKWRTVSAAFLPEHRKENIAWSFFELLASAPPQVRAGYLERLPEKGLTVEHITAELIAAGYVTRRKVEKPIDAWEAAKTSGVPQRVAQAIADAAAREGSRPVAHRLETVLGLRRPAREEHPSSFDEYSEEEEAQRLVKLLIQRDGADRIVCALRAILEHTNTGGGYRAIPPPPHPTVLLI